MTVIKNRKQYIMEYLISSQWIVDFAISQEQPREFQSDHPEPISQ